MKYKITITDRRDNEVMDEYEQTFDSLSQVQFHVEALRIILSGCKIRAALVGESL